MNKDGDNREKEVVKETNALDSVVQDVGQCLGRHRGRFIFSCYYGSPAGCGAICPYIRAC